MDAKVYQRVAEVEDSHWWFVARREILARAIAGLGLPRGARILEVGCGSGGNLPMLARYGQVYATETEPAAIDCARRRGCAQVEAGRLPQALPFADTSFDLVLMSDVLEHLAEEEPALRAIHARLADDAWLMLTVPAFPSLWSQHDEMHHHLRRYRAEPLRTLVTRCGYRVGYVSYFNSMLFPAIALVRRLHRLVGSAGREGHDLAMPPRLLNRMLTSLFGVERHFIGRVSLPAGVSLLLLARK